MYPDDGAYLCALSALLTDFAVIMDWNASFPVDLWSICTRAVPVCGLLEMLREASKALSAHRSVA